MQRIIFFSFQVKRSGTLKSIDKKLVDAGSFLKELMSGVSKLNCLEAFADSLKIVHWIRKETPQGEHSMELHAHYY